MLGREWIGTSRMAEHRQQDCGETLKRAFHGRRNATMI
jgi:hypothetical protein